MVVPEEMSRDELVVLVRRQAAQIAAQAGQIAESREANEALAGRLARVEHLLSRNSANSSSPPSKDGELGRTLPPEKPKRRGGAGGPPDARTVDLPRFWSVSEMTDRFTTWNQITSTATAA